VIKLEERIKTMMGILNELHLRLFLGSEASSYGYGGIQKVHEISGVSIKTIRRGITENKNNIKPDNKRVRKIGGGRKKESVKNPELINKVLKIVDPTTFGNPENNISYTTKSLRKIENELKNEGINCGYNIIANVLRENGYSLQLNQKMLQVNEVHPNKDEQFIFINDKPKEKMKMGQPVISVDTKKKELIGNFKNSGKIYNKKGEPTKVLDHDFPLEELGKVVPYGIYDIDKNNGFVNLGISKDTAEFAVESISRWWLSVGKNTYPNATMIYNTKFRFSTI